MRFLVFVIVVLVVFPGLAQAENWRGLVIAEEEECVGEPYLRREHYGHSQEREYEIVKSMGGRIYAPYTGRYFRSTRKTDINHMVAKREAHDSGLCLRDVSVRRAFGEDLFNLTLAGPRVNRLEKKSKDAGEWLPLKNRCWFANKIVLVKRKYNLTVDPREAAALEGVLSNCESFDMIYY